MTMPYEARTRPLYGSSADDFIESVLDCIPGEIDRARIEAELRRRLDPGISIERAVATYGQPRDVAEFYLASSPLQSAPFFRRLIAALIDIPSVIVTGLLMIYAGWKLFGPTESILTGLFTGKLLAVVLCVVTAMFMTPVYYVVAEWWTSQTVGKALMGIRTVRESGARVSLGQAFVRQIPLFFGFYVFDGLFALFTKKKQRLFELISKTRVVRA